MFVVFPIKVTEEDFTDVGNWNAVEINSLLTKSWVNDVFDETAKNMDDADAGMGRGNDVISRDEEDVATYSNADDSDSLTSKLLDVDLDETRE